MTTRPPPTSSPSPPSGAEHDALPPGTRFGEFEILRVLGVGGFGIVYLAQDHSLEREVALKEYMPASLAARGLGPQITVRSSSFAETYAIGLRSFVNEARLLARFDHPSLVKVYRFWEDNATAYMVMPFLQGVTLRDTRRAMAHPPDEPWIRSVVMPILSALELLHKEGVYHRDIAPDNILLSHGGPPVLLDFGAARRVISDRTQSLTAILKPSYAPIEQYAEMTQLRQGPWTDLYALGAVIHYLMFGAPPAPATARALQDEGDGIENRIVPGVSPRFLETVAWMLSVRPAQRPQSCEELRAVLDGRADIPARGRAGLTVPGVHSPTRPQLGEPMRTVAETAADATLVNTAHLPTHLPTTHLPTHVPTAQMAPVTTFSPTAQMPTQRMPPPASAPSGLTQPPPLTTGRTGTTQPPPLPAGRSGMTQPPPLAPGRPGATQPPPFRSSQPAPFPSASPAGLPSTVPPAALGSATAAGPVPARRTEPAALAAASAGVAARPASSGVGKTVAIVAGAVVVLAAVAAGAWKLGGGRGPAADVAGAASSSMTGASVPSTGTVPLATTTPTTGPSTTPTGSPVNTSASTTPTTTTPTTPTTTTFNSNPPPTTPPATVPMTSTPTARVGLPVPQASTLPTATPTGNATAGTANGDPRAGRPPYGGFDPTTRPVTGSDRNGFERNDERNAATGGASSARGRLAGRPVPRVNADDGSVDTTPTALPNGERPRPLGSPARDAPIAASDRARPGATTRDGQSGTTAISPSTRTNATTTTPPTAPIIDPNAASARQSCGGRVFIALYRCMEERCEEARFRNSAECVETLERKRARENR